MAPPSRFGWSSLTAFFFLFLSLLNITTASPLPDDHVKQSLNPRAQTSITEQRYIDYCKEYFKETDHYLFYSGGAEDQVKAFQAKNKGYFYYDNVFNAYDLNHPWYKKFNEDEDMDDAEASSKVLAKLASGDVLVFGAVESQQKGTNSFFIVNEIQSLRAGLREGRIKSINHMAKGATSTTDVIAKEDADGKLTWVNGHKEGEKNASIDEATCKKRAVCDPRKPNPKNLCGTKGKRAAASNGAACPLKPSSSKSPAPSSTKGAATSTKGAATSTKGAATSTKGAAPTSTKAPKPTKGTL